MRTVELFLLTTDERVVRVLLFITASEEARTGVEFSLIIDEEVLLPLSIFPAEFTVLVRVSMVLTLLVDLNGVLASDTFLTAFLVSIDLVGISADWCVLSDLPDETTELLLIAGL